MKDMAQELGISNSSAYSWLSYSGRVPSLMEPNKLAKSSKEWSAQEKFQAVMEFERLKTEPDNQGEFLRKAGLHASLVECWRKEMLCALGKSMPQRRAKRTPDEIAKDNKIVALERDLNRKDRALAETTALLILKKKAELIWGLVDDEEEK